MKLMKKIYKATKIFKYKLYRFYGSLKNKYILLGNEIDNGSIRIIGTPIINTNKGGKIKIGNNLCMNNGLIANQIGYNTPCILRAEGGSIIVGDNVGMSQTTLIAKGADITIGNNVKLGGGVKVYTTDFHCLDYMKRRDAKSDVAERLCLPVLIGDDCFVGAGVIILKGVTIGDRSIIGAGSVVTKNIPADCIAAGNPCRVIKEIARQ